MLFAPDAASLFRHVKSGLLFPPQYLLIAISTSTSRETTPESEEEDEDLGDDDEEEEDDFAEEESLNSPNGADCHLRSPKALMSRMISRNEEDLRDSYDRCFKELNSNQVS